MKLKLLIAFFGAYAVQITEYDTHSREQMKLDKTKFEVIVKETIE